MYLHFLNNYDKITLLIDVLRGGVARGGEKSTAAPVSIRRRPCKIDLCR